MEITLPVLSRLSKKAGIKTISKNCYPLIRELYDEELTRVLNVISVIAEEKDVTTLTEQELNKALELLNINITCSEHIGTTVITKK
jgi:hypothetical protein